MQCPHESVLENNPAFADLYPILEARVQQLLNPPEHEAQRLHLAELTRLWTKLKIMWDELQLVLVDDQYVELAKSVNHHISKARFQERYEKDLETLEIPPTHTFIRTPTNLHARLEILSDILAASLDEKLVVFDKLQQLSHETPSATAAVVVGSGGGGEVEGLAEHKEARDARTAECVASNAALRRQLSQDAAILYRAVAVTLENQADHLEQVRHGAVERFVTAYLEYHDLVTAALLHRARQSHEAHVTGIYTPELRSALEKHLREIRADVPGVRRRLGQVEEKIARHERISTPEYVDALAEYGRLKEAVAQAERDVDKLLHYKSSSR